MKTILHKSLSLFAITLFAFQAQGQACPEVWTENGTYKISTCGLSPELYMTINVSAAQGNPLVEWQPEITGDDETQLFTITDHRTPASAGLMEITANLTGIGAVTLCTDDASGHPNQTLTVRAGDPLSVEPGDYSGLDQFQRRRTSGFGGPGNDALFLRNPNGTNSRYGVIPTAAGDFVQFDGGGIDGLRFVLVAPLSTEELEVSSISISNPVDNELSIEGLNQNIKQVSVFSLMGQEILSGDVNDQSSLNFDVSDLSRGMYLVKFQGEKASFTKKFVKQ